MLEAWLHLLPHILLDTTTFSACSLAVVRHCSVKLAENGCSIFVVSGKSWQLQRRQVQSCVYRPGWNSWWWRPGCWVFVCEKPFDAVNMLSYLYAVILSPTACSSNLIVSLIIFWIIASFLRDATIFNQQCWDLFQSYDLFSLTCCPGLSVFVLASLFSLVTTVQWAVLDLQFSLMHGLVWGYC